MTKKNIILCFLIFCSEFVFGQTIVSDSTFIKKADKSIVLNSNFIKKGDRIVKLYETDTFVITTTYQIFVKNCENWISKHDLDWDKDLLQLFTQNEHLMVIDADKIVETNMQKSRLIFRISDLIEEQKCIIFNKVKNRHEKNIVMGYFVTKHVYGKTFKTSDKYLILEVINGVF